MSKATSNLTRRESITVWAGSAMWVGGVLVVAAVFLLAEEHVRVISTALAVVAIAGFLSVVTVIGRSVLRQEGVERAVYIDSSALAFWIMMGAAFTYMLLQAIADLPAADGYIIFGAGVLAWAFAHGARSEQYL